MRLNKNELDSSLCAAAGALGAGVLWMALTASVAHARPSGPRLICATYPESPGCTGALVTCETCHTTTDPVGWNAFGAALVSSLATESFDAGLATALQDLEDDDSDADGVPNLEELLLGTNPGLAESLWSPVPTPSGTTPFYQLGEYDARFAYRRAMVLYCGYSPSFEAMRELAEREPEEARDKLHADLAACLDGDYWRTTGLRELADPKIRPIASVGADTSVEIAGFKVVLADYDWDYRLWRYLMTDDRDMRGLLTAQYHVAIDDSSGVLTPVEGTLARTDPSALGGGQPLLPKHRAGMLTTQWFLMSNTMFSELPRTTAAQAYRAYLGMDISRQEGIWPVEGEPVDIDDKGVNAPACAQCHSTLDPLAYAFSYYEGIVLETQDETGTYRKSRPGELIANWESIAPTTVLLGQPVANVVEWGNSAAQSPAFVRSIAMTLFEHALGQKPSPGDSEEFAALLEATPTDGYSANRLIHRLVETTAFGTP